MIWVASEDAGTGEVTDFTSIREADLPSIMEWYGVSLCDPEPVHVQDMEDGHTVLYEGVIYGGGFSGLRLWVTRKHAV